MGLGPVGHQELPLQWPMAAGNGSRMDMPLATAEAVTAAGGSASVITYLGIKNAPPGICKKGMRIFEQKALQTPRLK